MTAQNDTHRRHKPQLLIYYCYFLPLLQDGTFYHGRNLDYGVPGLQDIAVNVNFTSKGKTVYQGTTYTGFIGLLTGMKPGAFSLSIDERDTKNGSVWANGE